MYSDFFAKYPVVNDEIINLDWVINKVKSMDTTLAEWIALAEELRIAIQNNIPDMQADITELFALVTDINHSISDLQQIRDNIAGLMEVDKDLQRQIDAINTNWNEIDSRFDSVNARIDTIKYVVGAEFLAELALCGLIMTYLNPAQGMCLLVVISVIIIYGAMKLGVIGKHDSVKKDDE